jgi:hypothetical protein
MRSKTRVYSMPAVGVVLVLILLGVATVVSVEAAGEVGLEVFVFGRAKEGIMVC